MTTFAALAALFDYPDDGYAGRVRACTAALPGSGLSAFADEIARLDTAALQERFIATFDLNPAATLEIGWHIFGEQYERGELLVRLRQRLREAGIEERRELPDHLLHVLPLLDVVDAAERATIVASCLAPALEKIARAVPPGNPFAGLVRAVRELLPVPEGAGMAAGEHHD